MTTTSCVPRPDQVKPWWGLRRSHAWRLRITLALLRLSYRPLQLLSGVGLLAWGLTTLARFSKEDNSVHVLTLATIVLGTVVLSEVFTFLLDRRLRMQGWRMLAEAALWGAIAGLYASTDLALYLAMCSLTLAIALRAGYILGTTTSQRG